MAANDTTTIPSNLEYDQLPWGDLIYATKAEMQCLGLAVGMAFPGEPDGPKRKLTVTDPRGFEAKIEVAYDGVRYAASIPFPGRSRREHEQQWKNYAHGVLMRDDYAWGDEFVGSAEALAAASLVRLDQLPGQPGMRKVIVRIFADGTIPEGSPNVRHKRSDEPGAKRIERASKNTYLVIVNVSAAETEKRREASRRAKAAYEAKMRALPRPAPLEFKPERLLPRPTLPADFFTTVNWESCEWRPKQ